MISFIRALIFIAALLLPASLAAAEGVIFRVTDASGVPVANAVVMVEVPGAPRASPAGTYVMKQENLAFDPYILIVPAGAEVNFPNLDRVRHHVYSFSRGNRFELKLYGREEHRAVTLSTPGIAAIGCNIHDDMVAYIRVVDTPYTGLTNAAGETVIDLPAGPAQANIWHPDASGQEMRIEVPSARTGAPIAASLRMRRRHHGH